jgi:hypothetical protein
VKKLMVLAAVLALLTALTSVAGAEHGPTDKNPFASDLALFAERFNPEMPRRARGISLLSSARRTEVDGVWVRITSRLQLPSPAIDTAPGGRSRLLGWHLGGGRSCPERNHLSNQVRLSALPGGGIDHR